MAKKAKKATKKVAAKGTKKATKKAAPKKATKKVVVAKATKTKAVKAKTKRKPNAAFMKPLTPSATLAAVIGAGDMPRTQVVKKPIPSEPIEPPVSVDNSIDLQNQIFSVAPIYPRTSEDASGLIAATWDGLFITRDEKKGWKQIKFENASLPYFNVVTTNPAIPGVILVGTDDGLFVSRDNGDTFAPMPFAQKTRRIQAIVFDPREPATIYLGTDDGLFLTYDGGLNWELRGNGLRTSLGTSAIVVNPSNPDEVYVNDQRQGGLFHSENKGRSWEQIETSRLPNTRFWTMSADPFDATSICIGSFSAGVYVMNKQVVGRKRQVGQ